MAKQGTIDNVYERAKAFTIACDVAVEGEGASEEQTATVARTMDELLSAVLAFARAEGAIE